jgi:hypothetical protein
MELWKRGQEQQKGKRETKRKSNMRSNYER